MMTFTLYDNFENVLEISSFHNHLATIKIQTFQKKKKIFKQIFLKVSCLSKVSFFRSSDSLTALLLPILLELNLQSHFKISKPAKPCLLLRVALDSPV